MHLDLALKALKVADLRAILAHANEQPPAKSTKADLIARILASQPAQDAYKELHEPEAAQEPPVEEQLPEAQPVPEVPPAEPAPPAEAPVDAELERRKARAARFGIPLVEQPAPKPKKTPAKAAAKVPEDPDKLQARAARFGIESKKRPPPQETGDPEEAERRRKRAERFGL